MENRPGQPPHPPTPVTAGLEPWPARSPALTEEGRLAAPRIPLFVYPPRGPTWDAAPAGMLEHEPARSGERKENTYSSENLANVKKAFVNPNFRKVLNEQA